MKKSGTSMFAKESPPLGYGQGVGYLDDGTMVVVEDGYRLMNRTEHVVVTKVLQTTAGRMIFAKP